MWVRSRNQDNPLEKGTATHSSILAWRIPWTEEPSGLWSRGSQRVRQDEVTEHAHALIPKGPSVADSENVTHMTQCTFKTPKETPKGVLRHNA